ncbi:MAG: hypothetical protein R6U59_02390 [Eubacteriales bacterium]
MNYDHRLEPKMIEEVKKDNPIKTVLQGILAIPMLLGFLIFVVFIVIPINIWDWVWK